MGDLTLQVRLKGDASGLVGEVKIADAALKGLGAGVQDSGQKLQEHDQKAGSLVGTYRALAGAAAAIGLGKLVADVISINTQYEKMHGSLVTVTGSQTAANAQFKILERFTTTTPFQLQEVVSAFIKLKTLGLDPSEAALHSYGNTAVAMGKSLDEVVGAVAGAAQGHFQRLREFGIEASEEGDRVSLTFRGVTTTVKNSSEAITRYLLDLGNVEYATALSDQAGTLDDAFSATAAGVSRLAVAFGQSGLVDIVKDLAGWFGELTSAMAENIEAGDNIVTALGGAIGKWAYGDEDERRGELNIRESEIDRMLREQRMPAAARANLQAERADIQQELVGLNALLTMGRGSAPAAAAGAKGTGGAGGLSGAAGLSVKEFQEMEKQLERQTALYNQVGMAAEVRYEIERAGLEETNPQLAARLQSLAAEADGQEAVKKKLEERAAEEQELMDFIMETSDQVAARQRKEMDDRKKSQQDWGETFRQSLLTETELENERYQKGLEQLNRNEAEKLASTMSYDEMRRRAEEDHQKRIAEIRDNANAEQIAKDKEFARQQAELALEPWKNALRGIQDAWRNGWEQLFRGNINSFGDLARQIKDIFIRLAAEIAALMTFRPAMMGLLTSIGMGDMASQLGLTGGSGFSLPGIPGMGNMFSGAGNFINNIGGMMGFGVPQAASSVALQGGSFYGSAAGGNFAGMAPGSFSGASLTGVLGAGAMGYMGGGMFADLLGLNSQNGSIGGAIGASIGMMTPLGPLGAVIGGALGSALGGLFGNDKDYPFTNAQVLVDKNGVATVGAVQSLDGGDDAAARALAEAAVQQFNAMVQAQGVTFDKPFAFYVGSNTQRGSDDQLGTGFYAGSYGGFAGGATVTGLQSPEQAVQAAVQYGLGKGSVIDPALRQLADQIKGDDGIAAGLKLISDQFAELRRHAKDLGLTLREVANAHRDTLLDLRDQVSAKMRNIADQARQILGLDQLTALQASFVVGPMSPLSPTDQFAALRGTFDTTAAAALAGDANAVRDFPGLAQQILGLGRDVFASGPEFQSLFTNVNTILNQVIGNQNALAATFDISVTLRETSEDQIRALKKEFAETRAELREIRKALRQTATG